TTRGSAVSQSRRWKQGGSKAVRASQPVARSRRFEAVGARVRAGLSPALERGDGVRNVGGAGYSFASVSRLGVEPDDRRLYAAAGIRRPEPLFRRASLGAPCPKDRTDTGLFPRVRIRPE